MSASSQSFKWQDKIVAHRGVSGVYPENTQIAFDAAYNFGFRWIETDVCMLGDDTLILFHDAQLGRTADGSEALSDLSWSAVKNLDIGAWKAPEFAGQKLMRLEECLKWAADKALGLHLEMKCHSRSQQRCAEMLASVLDRTPHGTVIVSSFDLDFLAHCRKMLPDVVLASIHDSLPPTITQTIDHLSLEAIHLDYRLLTSPQQVQRYKEKGICLRAWTVNDMPTAQRLFNWGVDMVMSDVPEQLCAAFEQE